MKITYIVWEQSCGKSYIARCYHKMKQRSLFCDAYVFNLMTDSEILSYDCDTIILDNTTNENIDRAIEKAGEFACRYLVLIWEDI